MKEPKPPRETWLLPLSATEPPEAWPEELSLLAKLLRDHEPPEPP